MDMDQEWTVFAADAEHDHFGMTRLVKVHNNLRQENNNMKAAIKDLLPFSISTEAQFQSERIAYCRAYEKLLRFVVSEDAQADAEKRQADIDDAASAQEGWPYE